MANGDPSDDDPEMGQSGPPGDNAPMQGGPSGPGGDLAAFARSKMGAQVSAPGPGNQADSMNLIIQAIQTLKQAGLGLQPGSKLHSDVFRTISQLSRHLGGAGGMGPAVGLQKKLLGGQAGGGPACGAPMPSTPLPGS